MVWRAQGTVEVFAARLGPLPSITRIGVLTGGGDAPGLNAVIRAVVKTASNSAIACIGIEDSFDGLLETDRSRVLTPRDVTGILRLGGTILGTLNTGNPLTSEVQTSDGPRRDRKSTRLNSSHLKLSRMPSSA